jgi:hypothetical protein
MERKAVRNIKVVKAFYCWHPNINKWIVEWTIKEFKNPMLEHYKRECDTEQEAKEVLSKLGDVFGGFLPYTPTSKHNFVLSAGQFVGYLDKRTHFVMKA